MTPKRPRDPNQLARSIIDITTGEKAVALGKNKNGGKARASALTASERREIALRAASSR